ncbi:hypothetical protein [Amycolatopsis sp. WAC 01375]|uniref:hypothetical protein n=1 Tax=Amycolatopsis sp. WAC 01375 TaxID=2203194 RepID=UPI0013152AF9|nr:hypothetical protein [Amycolatopsis sp. WAC 01375]
MSGQPTEGFSTEDIKNSAKAAAGDAAEGRSKRRPTDMTRAVEGSRAANEELRRRKAN